MIYKHNGDVTSLPKPPTQPRGRYIRTITFLLNISIHTLNTIIRVLQKSS